MSEIPKKRKLLDKIIGTRMTPESHLMDTRLFKAFVFIPIIIGSGLIAYTAWNEGFTPSITTDGFREFFTSFKLPSAHPETHNSLNSR